MPEPPRRGLPANPPLEETPPVVRVVVVNHDGGELLVRCVDQLASLRWPPEALELVVVDNASRDGSADAIKGRVGVRLIRADRNHGFGAATNLALAGLEDVEFVALVNNDAFVAPGWLQSLVDVLRSEPDAGAACPKVHLADTFASIDVETATHRRGWGDHRELGVRLEAVRVDGEAAWDRLRFANGWHGPEWRGSRSFQWTAASARLYVPIPNGSQRVEVELLVSSDRPKVLTARTGGASYRKRVGASARWIRIPAGPLGVDLLNAAGGCALVDGYGGDRGYLEPDRGQYDTPCEVFGWPGCAVLLRRAYLDEVGLFDPRLFMYYEDFDLSWRGRSRGWRYLYTPAANVSHVHAASAGRTAWRAEYWKERNRLIVHTKNAPAHYVGSVYADAARGVALHLMRDVVSRVLHGERPHFGFVTLRTAALLGSLLALPWTLRDRRRVRRAKTVTDDELLAGWTLATAPGGSAREELGLALRATSGERLLP